MATKKTQYNDAWKKENTDFIRIFPRKDKNIPARIEAQVNRGKAKSRQDYILKAIRESLEQDEKE